MAGTKLDGPVRSLQARIERLKAALSASGLSARGLWVNGVVSDEDLDRLIEEHRAAHNGYKGPVGLVGTRAQLSPEAWAEKYAGFDVSVPPAVTPEPTWPPIAPGKAGQVTPPKRPSGGMPMPIRC